jgi:hypothetical protein
VPGSTCLIKALVHLWSVLSGSPSLDHLLDNTIKCANAHSSLSVPCQGVVTSKWVSTETRVRLAAGMYFGMAFQVVASNETFLAVVASELTIAKMGLDVGLDVLLPTELLIAILKFANPFVIHRVWSFDELRNFIQADVGLLNRCLNARL